MARRSVGAALSLVLLHPLAPNDGARSVGERFNQLGAVQPSNSTQWRSLAGHFIGQWPLELTSTPCNHTEVAGIGLALTGEVDQVGGLASSQRVRRILRCLSLVADALVIFGLACSEDSSTRFTEGDRNGGDTACADSCGPNMQCNSLSVCECASGYKDCNQDPTDGCECSAVGEIQDAPEGIGCGGGCDPGQICAESNLCEDIPLNNGVVMELRLRHVADDRATAAAAEVGRASVLVFRNEALPPDGREPFDAVAVEAMDDPPRCFHEMRTRYPYVYAVDLGASVDHWPTPNAEHYLDAGDLIFDITSAERGDRQVVMRYTTGSLAPTYTLARPTSLKKVSGGAFDARYAPEQGRYAIDVAGGQQVDPAQFAGGQLPGAFIISEPAQGAETALDQDLTIAWSPAQPGTRMRVEVSTSDASGPGTLLSCVGADGGAITLPQSMVVRLGSGIAELHLTRELARYHVDSSAGEPLYVQMWGSTERIRVIQLTRD